MKFTYREIPILFSPASKRKRFIYRPIIPVILVRDKGLVGYEALIDSGSDYNVFDASVADILGIKVSAGFKRQIIGIGEQRLRGYEHNVTLKIAGKQYKTKVIFSKHIPPNSFGILGNEGFFNHFKVTFNCSKRYFEVI